MVGTGDFKWTLVNNNETANKEMSFKITALYFDYSIIIYIYKPIFTAHFIISYWLLVLGVSLSHVEFVMLKL